MTAKLFVSYSHKDEEYREKLETHLALLKREKLIDPWHHRKIGAGGEWAQAIDENLKTADVVLLLISADFIASDYCYDVEMKGALERHDRGEACVIPVILRKCEWRSAPFARLQALPKDAKPVNSWNDVDEAWADVARGVQQAIQSVARP